jgi:hypothetical protein
MKADDVAGLVERLRHAQNNLSAYSVRAKRGLFKDAASALESPSARVAELSGGKPRAWLCELAQEDGTVRTMFVEEDPAGLRFNDSGEPSPFRVTPLFLSPTSAVDAEREACAALCEWFDSCDPKYIAAAIPHWQAHCDADGYGPANLQRRLEEGIPSEYGYTAGAFAAQAARIAELEAEHSQMVAANTAMAQHNGTLQARLAAAEADIATAYGYLWHVNNEPGTPHQYPPERAAYEARKVLRERLTKEQRGAAINAVRAMIDAAHAGEAQ